MSVYKSLSQNDISKREFYAYKEFVLTENTTDLQVQSVRRITNTHFYPFPAYNQTGSSGFYSRPLYDSVKHLYYYEEYALEHTSSNDYSGVRNDTKKIMGISANNPSTPYPLPFTIRRKYYPEPFNLGPNNINNTIYKNLGNQAVVISIPQNYFGERIKPGSVSMEEVTEGFTLVDDGQGNLYNSAESSSFASNNNGYHRGNIFYETGNAVITSLSGSYQNFGTGSNSIVVTFQSTELIHELEMTCMIKEGEFNLTMNPSARVSRSLLISEPLGFVTGSDFTTYPTTIGFYDDSGSLLAISKLPQPIRNEPDLALTFVSRLYW